MIHSIHHPCICVQDMDQSLALYQDLLGLEKVQDMVFEGEMIGKLLQVDQPKFRIVHLKVADDILDLTFPELMAPQPALTLVQFTPRKRLRKPTSVPAGAELMGQTSRGTSRQVRLRVSDPVEMGDFELAAVEEITTDAAARRLAERRLAGAGS